MLEKPYLILAQSINNILRGNKTLSLQENLLIWIENTRLIDDKLHSATIKELKEAAEKAETEKQLIDSLLEIFGCEPLNKNRHLSQSAELIRAFCNYVEEIEEYSLVKKDLGKLIAYCKLPLHETVKHIRNIIAYL